MTHDAVARTFSVSDDTPVGVYTLTPICTATYFADATMTQTMTKEATVEISIDVQDPCVNLVITAPRLDPFNYVITNTPQDYAIKPFTTVPANCGQPVHRYVFMSLGAPVPGTIALKNFDTTTGTFTFQYDDNSITGNGKVAFLVTVYASLRGKEVKANFPLTY